MQKEAIFVGKTPLRVNRSEITGEYVSIAGERFYKISNYDGMAPFFMSIVSDSDHWMFISSNGGLTAGRKDSDNALFPYYTDDKIRDLADVTGSRTVVFVRGRGRTYLWEPFSNSFAGIYQTKRNLYKNVLGNKVYFEEINEDLFIAFRYGWCNSERFGFVRHCEIANRGSQPLSVNVLDGIQNILPHGIGEKFQSEYSTLADGYKKNEQIPGLGLGIYRLSSIPTDKAEPSEALKATTAWSTGLPKGKRLISSLQVGQFVNGNSVDEETDIRGARGAYFLNSEFDLSVGGKQDWYIVAETDQRPSDVVFLTKLLEDEGDLKQLIQNDVDNGCERLKKIVASADGLQLTADEMTVSRHFSNVLFNLMRGGVFEDGYTIEKTDFESFLMAANTRAFHQYRGFLASLPDQIDHADLLRKVTEIGVSGLERSVYEYLPLSFSRRHGDPSRPWNRFSIEVKDETGRKTRNYQGNWRDIFQNWEALAISFPGYLESMISKFVNASTPDGYNPYRVTRDGFDWEVLDPDDAWSYIGYWGDHQIVYLLKLLELSLRYHPDKLKTLLLKDIYTYANVPYRIKGYRDLLKNPRDTIDFDYELDNEIKKRVRECGTDGKLVWRQDGQVCRVNLAEKLLVTILAKISNFVPEAGIWMNTQRPEWNDANNALAGYGLSVVTLCYLRRLLAFAANLFRTLDEDQVTLSVEVAEKHTKIFEVLLKNAPLLSGPITDRKRKLILDKLGRAGSEYRLLVYERGFSDNRTPVSIQDLIDFFDLAKRYMDHSIRANKREDGLYHAYNLMQLDSEHEISIRRLYEMLEGQVAVLSSGSLSAAESLDVLDSLRQGKLYREDQNSFLLYPDRQLPRFMEKNNVPEEQFKRCDLLQALVAKGNEDIVIQDVNGQIHFNGKIRNSRVLAESLRALNDDEFHMLVTQDMDRVMDIYERLFDHRSFTGRSGTFFKYEGLGCIYWHMVSKLLLAVQERCFASHAESEAEQETRVRLAAHYYKIRAGLGPYKSPELHGAFPSDPYSHTPQHTGAQQPGMTGQVKEDILSRFGELGITVHDAKILIAPGLLKREEFLRTPKPFTYYDVNGSDHTIDLDAGMLAFTLCQVPFVYILSEAEKINVTLKDGTELTDDELAIGQELSSSIFARRGVVEMVTVFVRIA